MLKFPATGKNFPASATSEENDLISEGRLLHKNTILLKYEFLKNDVLHRFGRRSRELKRVEGWRK